MIEIHELTVRDGTSGDPSLNVDGAGIPVLESSRRAVILIHGFANKPAQAEESYARLATALVDALWPTRPQGLATFFGFHWPGNHPFPLVNQLTYSSRIPAATNSGHALGRLLAHLPRTTEIVLVAHSLGCRVLLATLEWLITNEPDTGPRISAAYLLAAAVPVADAVGPARFADRYPGARYEVLYSHRDHALGLAFAGGQALFDHRAEAVGRNGMPDRDRWDRRIDTGLGHSHYWRSPRTARSVAHSLSPFGLHLLPILPADLGIADYVQWVLESNDLRERHLRSRLM
ncbi:MAG TPA: alpha/beta hydrolase [Micromonosporaceae bacterium]|jgi:esterase/lipase superfamily enzyme